MKINKDFFKKNNKTTIIVISILLITVFYLYITKIKPNSIREYCAQEVDKKGKNDSSIVYEFYYNKCLNSKGLKKEY